MSKLENEFGAIIRKTLRDQGCEVYPLVGGRGIPRGWPDMLVWHRLWDGLIELKGPDTLVEPLQVEKLKKLHAIRPRCAVLYRQANESPKSGLDVWGRLYWYSPERAHEWQIFYNSSETVRVTDLLHCLRNWRDELQ